MLTRKSWPAELPWGLVIVADDAAAAQCVGSAEPGPLGMIGCCAPRACRYAAFASGVRFVQSREVSNVSSSVLTTGGICARSERSSASSGARRADAAAVSLDLRELGGMIHADGSGVGQ